MSYKLIMYWDIQDGREQEYFEFMVREYMPVTARLGLQMVAAWYTVYSRYDDTSRIMMEGLAEDKATIRAALKSPDWHDIQAKLLDYVENYSQKVVEVNGSLQF